MMNDNEPKPADADTPYRRPNAGYKLSRETVNGEQLTFYYDRQRRLAKAPQVVRDLYKEEPPRRFGLFRSLVGSKPRAMMFGSIMLVCAAMLVLSVLGYTGDTSELEGNEVSVQALALDGMSVVTLRKTIKKGGLFPIGQAYAGAVDLAVAPAARAESSSAPPSTAAENPPVFYHRIFFSHETREEYRFSVPFDSGELVLVLKTDRKTLSVKIKNEAKPLLR